MPMPVLALEVQRGGMPGHPGANRSFESVTLAFPIAVQDILPYSTKPDLVDDKNHQSKVTELRKILLGSDNCFPALHLTCKIQPVRSGADLGTGWLVA